MTPKLLSANYDLDPSRHLRVSRECGMYLHPLILLVLVLMRICGMSSRVISIWERGRGRSRARRAGDRVVGPR
jgi:hypothetical protein